MIITNLLTKLNFSDITVVPSRWPLLTYIPEGIVAASTLQVRWRTLTTYWSAWFSVVVWDDTTKEAVWTPPLGVVPIEVEFRRVTPKYALVRDPLSPTSRVSAPHLQINSDQGMMVAIEWAAEYGVDGHSALVSGDGPVIADTMHSQCHWGPDADFSQKVWNFQFTGGYLQPEHVKAQARVDGVWQGLAISTTPSTELTPNAAPFRLQGEYQLFLDLSTLDGKVDGLIVYRRTFRETHVSSPEDAELITAEGMRPSAAHAFFVAVELGEEMSRRVPECECALIYTTTLLPPIVEDTMSRRMPTITDGQERRFPSETMGRQMPLLAAGVLKDVLVTYTNWRDVAPETISRTMPDLISGELTGLTGAIVYTNWRDISAETVQRTMPDIASGELTVLVILVTYTNWRDVAPETIQRTMPALTGGTLT